MTAADKEYLRWRQQEHDRDSVGLLEFGPTRAEEENYRARLECDAEPEGDEV